MTKILVIPPHKEDISELLSKVDGILVGVKNFSNNFTEISKEELEKITKEVKKANKEIFISLNKNMHHADLEALTELLKKCNQLKVDGVFYYDVAVLSIHHKLSLEIPLIWSAEHLTTNAYTIGYWENFGISGTFLSNEITMKEILEIHQSTKTYTFVQVFGYLPMYVSRRLAIDNYLKHFHLKRDAKEFYLWKENHTYPILEREKSTEIYSSFLLNAISEFLEYQESGIEYAIISGFLVPYSSLEEVITCFQEVTEENVEEKKQKIQELFPNTGNGFLYKETVYQVKKNEK